MRLVKLGLRPIPAKGEPFDPYLHQAIEMVDTTRLRIIMSSTNCSEDYKLKDRLAPSFMVRVARNPAANLPETLKGFGNHSDQQRKKTPVDILYFEVFFAFGV